MVGSRKEELGGESCVFASVVKQEVVAVEECPKRRRTWTGAWGGDAFKTAGKKSQGLGGGFHSVRFGFETAGSSSLDYIVTSSLVAGARRWWKWGMCRVKMRRWPETTLYGGSMYRLQGGGLHADEVYDLFFWGRRSHGEDPKGATRGNSGQKASFLWCTNLTRQPLTG